MTYGQAEFEQDQMDRGRDRDDEEVYLSDHDLAVAYAYGPPEVSHSALLEMERQYDEDTF